jgi:FMN phosphatase YigB (HAD superfamily)
MIKRLAVFDFDGTLMNSPMPETGKKEWSEKMDKEYPFSGWWGRPESLDLEVFDIKPFPSVLKQLKKEIVTPGTYVIVLTSRMEKLRSEVEAVLDANKIKVDKFDMKRAEGNKGVKVMRYVQQLPDLKVINVYEDRDVDIEAYEEIRSKLPSGVEFNIYRATEGTIALTETSRSQNALCIIQDELKKIII